VRNGAEIRSRPSLASNILKIEIGADEATGSYVLWVRENGIGFDMKNHDGIFGIFSV